MSEMSKAGAFFANGFLGFEDAFLENFKSINPASPLSIPLREWNWIHAAGYDHGDHQHEKGVDPHTWSSPDGARVIAKNIFDGMVKIDPANKVKFQENLDRLLTKSTVSTRS